VNKLELVDIGHTKKPKGIHGYLRIEVKEKYIEDLSNARALFLDLDGSQVPFLIEKFIVDSQLLIKLDEVDTPQQAELYTSKSAFLDKKEIKLASDEEDEAHPWIGYQVIDQEQNLRGSISSIEAYPNQLMSFIVNENHSFMMPIHEDTVMDVDDSKKVLQINMPEGIEELFSE
jgi:16S rRNA processing protein RimM